MIFDSVTLSFEGRDYVVKEGQLWGLAEAVEEVVSMVWLAPRLTRGDMPAGRIFRAYAAALKYAGAKDVNAEQIAKGVDHKRMVEMAYELAGILTVTMPGADVNLPTSEVDEEKKIPAADSSKSATSSGSSGDTHRVSSGASIPASSGGSRKRR